MHQQLMETWENHKADVLVGTQMIAKGMHIPNVTLVGVVLADVGLLMHDFRAAERTYQALRQVAGRTGRGDDSGKVIIQTYLTDHYAVQAAAELKGDSFYDRELTFRKAYRYPPLARLIRLVYTNSDPTSSRQESSRMALTFKRLARQWGMDRIDIIGPAPAYPPRNKQGWQWQLLLRGDNPHLLLNKIIMPPKWSIDVDPMTVN
jgi:primosomal protein N' (replication factor Y)